MSVPPPTVPPSVPPPVPPSNDSPNVPASASRSAARRVVLALVLMLVLGLALGWWLGRQSAAPAAPTATPAAAPTPPATAPATPAAPAEIAGPPNAAPVSVSVASDGEFALESCAARLQDGRPALVLSFTQPLKAEQDWAALLPVARLEGNDPVKTVTADGQWVLVSNNPRVLYFPYVSPESRYRVTRHAGITDVNGSVLPEAEACELTVDAMPPSFAFGSQGVVIPAGQGGGLPVITVNMPELDVEFLRVKPDQLANFFDQVLGLRLNDDNDNPWRWADNRQMQGAVGQWDLDRLATLTESVYSGRFETHGKPNQRTTSFLPVEALPGVREPGLYVAVLREPGRFRYQYQVTYFHVSDLGVQARQYPGNLGVFVTALDTAKGLGDVALTVLDTAGKEVAQGKTDAEGVARLAVNPGQGSLLLARRGNDTALLSLRQPALDLSEYAVTGLAPSPRRLFVPAGRDIYRPGERIDVPVLARDADARLLTALPPLQVQLRQPDGRIVQQAAWQPGQAPGWYAGTLDLPQDAQTGGWRLELRLDPTTPEPDHIWAFDMQAFVPERLALTLEGTPTVQDKRAQWPVAADGQYLYGAPGAGLRLLGELQVSRQRAALPQAWPGFIFGDVNDDSHDYAQSLETELLDDDGRANWQVEVPLDNVASPLRAIVNASLLEAGGQPVMRRIERTLWPREGAWIGIRPGFTDDTAASQSLASVELVRVDTKGELQPLAEAQLRLYAERREYYWRYDPNGSPQSGYTEYDELVDARSIALNERTTVSLPVDWGRYRLEVVDPETGATLRYRFHAGWQADAQTQLGDRPDRVRLRLEADHVTPGETTRLEILPPHDGIALVTLEADQLLWQARLPVKRDGTWVDLPIPAEAARHDLYVNVVVFRPTGTGDARLTPARAMGVLYLPLARESRRLDVTLQAPTRTRPGQTLTLPIQVPVPEGDGSAWVYVSAVDAGILNLTQYAAPDPFGFFFGQQRYAVALRDLYGRLVERMAGVVATARWGGDAAAGQWRNLPQQDRLLDLALGPVQLDAEGKASVQLTLPDFNGLLRVRAIAFTDSRYGKAEADVTVAAPVIVQAGLPRFLNHGDTAQVVLDISNRSGRDQTLALNLAADGALSASTPVETLTLADGARQTVPVRLSAGNSGREGRLTVTVSGIADAGPAQVQSSYPLPVYPVAPPRQASSHWTLAPGNSATLELPALPGTPDAATLTLSGANLLTPPPAPVPPLTLPPWPDVESTLSLALLALMSKDEVSAPPGISPVDQALQRMASLQRQDGAFGAWRDAEPDLWLSAYALDVVQRASAAGHTIPGEMHARLRTWLQERLRNASGDFAGWPDSIDPMAPAPDRDAARLLTDGHARFAGYAYAGQMLANEQAAPLAALRHLAHVRTDRARSPLPLMQLAVALHSMGDAARSQQVHTLAQTRGYGMGPSYSYWMDDYGSRLRDTAWSASLSPLLPNAQGDDPWLREAADLAASTTWFSLQERQAILRAAEPARSQDSAGWLAQLAAAAGSQPPTTAQAVPWRGPLPLASSAYPLALQNTGTTPLQATVTYTANPLQSTPVADGMHIDEAWYLPDGTPWKLAPLASGERRLVVLRLRADFPVERAEVIARLPAGLILEPLARTPQDGFDVLTVGDRTLGSIIDSRDVLLQSEYDDRYTALVKVDDTAVVAYQVRAVTPGEYRMPPPQVADVYRPDRRALGTGGTMVIRSP